MAATLFKKQRTSSWAFKRGRVGIGKAAPMMKRRDVRSVRDAQAMGILSRLGPLFAQELRVELTHETGDPLPYSVIYGIVGRLRDRGYARLTDEIDASIPSSCRLMRLTPKGQGYIDTQARVYGRR